MNSNRHVLNAIILTIFCVICYHNTLNGTFVFDDTEAIVNNIDLDTKTPLINILKNDFWGTNIWSNTSHKSYRPVTVLVYKSLVAAVGYKNPLWFHTLNLFLYILVCITLYSYLCIPLRSDIAFKAAILFSVHPVHTEVVASVVGCADLLCSVLFCFALKHFHKAILSSSLWHYLFALALTCLATFCKEIGITALGVFCLLDLLLNSKSKKLLSNRPWLLRLFGIFIIGLLLLYVRCRIMNFTQPSFQSADNPASFADNLLIRFLTYSYIYTLNIIILLWPQWLCFDWSMGCISLIENSLDLRILAVLIFWIFVILYIYKAIIYCDMVICLSLLIIIVPFIPASNLLFRVGFVIAERVLFLPSAGLCILVVYGWHKLYVYKPSYKKHLRIGYWFLVIIFTMRTYQRGTQWLNEQTLFNSALEICPTNAKVHYNVAKLAADMGNLNYAEYEYRHALQLHPNYDQAMNNLANLLRDRGQVHEAKELLIDAINLRPDFAAAWMNLGIVLATLGEDDEAESCYKKALVHRHKYSDCYYNLGNLYLKQLRQEEALNMWFNAIEINPSHSAAWSNMLVLLDSLGHYDKVIQQGQLALTFCPVSAAIHFTMANTLGKLERWTEAEHHFKNALNLNPQNALYHSNLGVLYHRWGKLDQAKKMYQTALVLNPRMNTTAYNLNKIRKLNNI